MNPPSPTSASARLSHHNGDLFEQDLEVRLTKVYALLGGERTPKMGAVELDRLVEAPESLSLRATPTRGLAAIRNTV